MIKAKSIDLNDFFIQALLTGKAEVEINKVQIRVNMHYRPKTFGIGLTSSIKGHEGVASSSYDIESSFSMIRQYYEQYAGHPLPETTTPPVRTWYVEITRGLLIPFYKGSYRPNLKDFLITNDQTGEEEYFFTVPKHLVPHYGFDREGDTMYVPRYSVWERSLKDYIPKQLAHNDTSLL